MTRVVEFDVPKSGQDSELERKAVEHEVLSAERDPLGYRPQDGFWVVNGERIHS